MLNVAAINLGFYIIIKLVSVFHENKELSCDKIYEAYLSC